MVRQHDDGQLRPDSFDLIGDGPAIEKAEVEFDDNGIHGQRHEKTQTLGAGGGGREFIAVFRQ